MFEISSDPKPITGKQMSYLPRLIAVVRKEKYQAIKRELGLQHIGLTRLTAGQASKLISELKKAAGQ